MKTKFDDVDLSILEILMRNGRERMTKISELISLSNTGIKKRISKLNDNGLLKIRGNLNIKALQLKACLITLEIENHKNLAKIVSDYKYCPYVFFIAETIGNFNLVVGFYGNNDNDLNTKLKFCGPTNREGILHSKITFITEFKFPKFFPLHFLHDKEDLAINCCGCSCQDCEAYLNKACRSCR